MMEVRQVFIRSSILAVLLLTCAAVGQPRDEDWSFDVDRATQEIEGGHCLAHEFNIPGQGVHLSGSGVHLSGSVGGMMLGPITYEKTDDASVSVTITPVDARTVLDETTGPAQTVILDQEILRDVLIIVADDFAKGNYTIPEVAFGLSPNDIGRAQLAGLVDTGEFSHGALVLHHLNALIAATGRFRLEREELPDWRQPNQTIPIYIWEQADTGAPGRVIVAPLDMADFQDAREEGVDVEAVLTALNSELGYLTGVVIQAFSTDLKDAFVNFSWVFLPCTSVQAFLADPRGFESYDQYLESIKLLGETVDISQLIRFLGSDVSQTLTSYFQHGEGFDVPVERLMFAAAAGNFAREYQMLPAGWQYVVGASVAAIANRDFPGRYANAGDVTVAGEWISLQRLSDSGELEGTTDLSYAGTSFAAPLVSLYSALDMVSEERCSGFDSNNPGHGRQPSDLVLASQPKDAFSQNPGDVWLPDAIVNCP